MLIARVVVVVLVGVLLAVVGPRLRHPSDVETVLAARFEQHSGLVLDDLECSILKEPSTYRCEGLAKAPAGGEGLPIHLEVIAPAADPSY